MESDIMLTDELLKKTAKELGLPYKTVLYIYRFAVGYLHKQINATDACSFLLPYLGTIYVKSEYVDQIIQENLALKNKGEYDINAKRKLTVFEHKKKHIDTYLRVNNRPRSYCNHFLRSDYHDKYLNHGKTLEEIQDIQNSVYKKTKDENESIQED